MVLDGGQYHDLGGIWECLVVITGRRVILASRGESPGVPLMSYNAPDCPAGKNALVARSCQTLCSPVDCSLPGPPVHGISQTRILERVAISFFEGSSRSRDGNRPGNRTPPRDQAQNVSGAEAEKLL